MLLNQTCYRAFLKEEYARRAKSNPQYSCRAFARQLGLSPGELSEVLNKKRKLSLKSAMKIASVLNLNSAETRHLVHLSEIDKSNGWKKSAVDKTLVLETSAHKQELSLDLFNIVSDWTCFAIINLTECEDFRWNRAWIAKRLGISPTEVEVALARLQKVGLIKKEKGRLSATKDYVVTPDGIPSEALRNYHREMLGQASRALDLQPAKERQNVGMGFAVNPKDIPRLKEEISNFVDELVERYSNKRGKKEVYQLELALFKLTRSHGYVH